MNHKVNIVVSKNGNRETILESKHIKIREKILKLLFGDFSEVIVLNPKKHVKEIQIQEIKE